MKYVLGILFLLTSVTTQAQTATDSVKQVVTDLFKAMATSDSVKAEMVFTRDAIMQSFARNKEGQTIIRTDKPSDFASQIKQTAPGDLDERIEFETVKIDGNLAMVWTPYKFYYKGKFSHCGVNSFQLVKLNNEWKIQYLIDTRRKAGCE